MTEQLTFEEQIDLLFSQPKRTITAEQYLREQRKVKKQNREIQKVITHNIYLDWRRQYDRL